MTMTTEQTNRAKSALIETMDLIERESSKRMFDDHQEAEKSRRLAFLRSHADKLKAMLSSGQWEGPWVS